MEQYHGWRVRRWFRRLGQAVSLPVCNPSKRPDDETPLSMFGTNAIINELEERGDLWLAVQRYQRRCGTPDSPDLPESNPSSSSVGGAA